MIFKISIDSIIKIISVINNCLYVAIKYFFDKTFIITIIII